MYSAYPVCLVYPLVCFMLSPTNMPALRTPDMGSGRLSIATPTILKTYTLLKAGPVAARSKAYVCGRSPTEIVGSNPTGGHGCLL